MDLMARHGEHQGILREGEVEILAPARDVKCGRVAIDCGADAVYIGAYKFGAREAAGNDLDSIANLADYAHQYWARVYVTVNTLLRDDELPQTIDLISNLYDIGIDGLIIQDVGLLMCDLPPIPLIASTQMHNTTPERVAFLEQAGIQRVILARELSLDQIKDIRSACSVELECFVHGALCVCYSGQCYLSYALGGRSGNRGQCAQPCRKPYDLLDASGEVLVSKKHLLSLKDLNLSDHLDALLRAGVRSFKIEGRLKDSAYVANVVGFYRKKLDEILAKYGLHKSSSGTVDLGFEPDPAKTFNRGYTCYFLHGNTKRIASVETPKMVGEVVGWVKNVRGCEVTLCGPSVLRPGDGVAFFDNKGELCGSTVNASCGNLITLETPQGIQAGAKLFRNRDHAFLSRIENARPRRTISVSLSIHDTGEGIALEALDEDGISAAIPLVGSTEPAAKPDQARETICRQLSRTGGTHFDCRSVEVEPPIVPFMPISALNSLRRQVLDKLTTARNRARPRGERIPAPGKPGRCAESLSFESNVLNREAEAFYRRCGAMHIEPAAESGLDMRGRRLMTTRYCIRRELGICPGSSAADLLYLRDTEGRILRLEFDCARCGMDIYLDL